MGLKFRKQVLLFKLESVYGSDPTLSETTDAILVANLQIQPLQADMVTRNLIRGSLGGESQQHINLRVGISFQIEIAGSGIAGKPPAYDSVMQACALSSTQHSLTNGTATAGGANTITLAAGASASNDTYNGMYITLDGGTGSGQSKKITDYVGSTKVATVDSAWSTPPDATSTYDVFDYVTYAPISDAMKSAAAYFWIDGIKQVITGIRGSLSWQFDPKGIAHMQFTGIGNYADPTAVSNPVPVMSGFMNPLDVSTSNTTFTLHSYAAPMASLSVDQANQVMFRSLVGGEGIEVTDRRTSGTVTIEEPATGTKDYYPIIRTSTLGALEIVHGTTVGNIVTLGGNYVQLLNPQRSNSDGVAMLQLGLSFIPNAGDDEMYYKVA